MVALIQTFFYTTNSLFTACYSLLLEITQLSALTFSFWMPCMPWQTAVTTSTQIA